MVQIVIPATTLPKWVTTVVDVNTAYPSVDSRMEVLHKLAKRNVEEGTGGPFAAMVTDADTGELISIGVNLVLQSQLSVMHAEVVALSLAQANLKRWDLGAPGERELELTVNWRPCMQCMGAVLWSGVKQLKIAGEGPLVERLTGFDEGPVPENWKKEFEKRGITVQADCDVEGAKAVFTWYSKLAKEGKVVVYNSGGR